MSDTNVETQFAYGDRAINARAADWVIARREGVDWTETRQSELDAWLAESSANTIAYLRIDSTWSRADRLGALRPPGRPHAHERLRPLLARVGAALAALLVVGVVASSFMHINESAKTYSTAVGGRTTITLSDGSRLELNTDTSVRISDKKAERKVWLDKGEAYFDVRHDPAHPFLLLIGDHRIVDVGTKFIVRRNASQTRVAITEGSVRFESGMSGKQLTLGPGDVVVATSKSVFVSKEPAQDLAVELGWRIGVVTFRHTTLVDAAAELNRYDVKRIVVADRAARSMRISGTFPVHSATLFARLVGAGLGLHVDDRVQGIIIISR